MKSKIKKFINSKLFIFIITALVFSTIGVSAATYFESSAVTYDNTESGLNSTDVQGAIDELYSNVNTQCLSGLTVNVAGKNIEIVASCAEEDCPGLYQDPRDKKRFIYRGANPNNYVTFNNEKAGWRIISVEPDKTIKIVRDKSIGSMAWNSTSRDNNWTSPATLNTYLNNDYYNNLTVTAQNQIVNHDFEILKPVGTWNGKIGLPTVYDLSYATSKLYGCTHPSTSDYHYNSCDSYNWLHYNGTDWWTMSAYSHNSVYYANGTRDTYTRLNYSYPTEELSVRPALYLSSDIKITGGDGSQNNPYTIE